MPLKLFGYGLTEMKYLSSRDAKLTEIIERQGFIERYCYTDFLECIISQILAQQISNKAYKTILARLNNAVGSISANKILSLGSVGLNELGITGKKCDWIINISKSYTGGMLNPQYLLRLDDAELCNKLTAFDGIGRWTAEMIMIFGAERKNILSRGDFAIRKGVSKIYGVEPSSEVFSELLKIYTPYATIASFYIWTVGNGEC